VAAEVMTAVVNTLRLAVVATLIGFVLGSLFGFVAGYFRNSWVDRLASCCRCWACRCRTTGWAW
jgi:peptide/nickel transport system permease protein